jgi:hypothetical protein
VDRPSARPTPTTELVEAIEAYRETAAARRFAELAAGAEGRLRSTPVEPVQLPEAPATGIDLAQLRRWSVRVAQRYAVVHAEHPELSGEEAVDLARSDLGW